MLPTFLIFLIVLSLVILIHELGHFLAAKKIGVRVEEFGLGYPPRAIGKKVGETIYSLNWLPFGGFVRLFGEVDDTEQRSKSKRAFYNRKKREKAIVILAGVFMNMVLALVCFSLIYSIKGIPEEVNYVVVDGIAPNSPAEIAGIQVSDKILAIDEKEMNKVDEFVAYVGEKGGQEIVINYERDGVEGETVLIPRENPPEGEGAVGVMVSNFDNIFYPAWQMPFRGIIVGMEETYGWTIMMFSGLGKMVKDVFSGQSPEVSGVVGIYQTTGVIAEMGFLAIIKFIGILSVNLAVINIMPFPALDGGRFAFMVFEKIIGKSKPKLEATINMAGMIFLIGLMILITFMDVKRLVGR